MSTSPDMQGDAALFGLTKAQLLPILQNIAGEPVSDFETSVEHEVSRAYAGKVSDTVIPTFTYTTRSGRAGQETVFIKRQARPGLAEAHHYEYLLARNVPLPRLYGSLVDAQQREIIFLEYVEACTEDDPIFMKDHSRSHPYLSAVARLNAIAPSGEYLKNTWRLDLVEHFKGWTPDAFWDDALHGKLGEALQQLCRASADHLPQLRGLAGRLVEPVSQMDEGFVIQDCSPHQTGLRETGELVLFDLAYACFAPRFFDVAMCLGTSSNDEPWCCSRRELAEHYLNELVRHGGAPTPVDEVLRQTRILRIARSMWHWGWYHCRALGENVDPDKEDADEIRRVNIEKMHRELKNMLAEEALTTS